MPGELRVSIPGMPTAYYRNAERTAERFKYGWFLTRDIGRVTTDGLIEIEGRVDDRINLGGQKLHPERIENVLQQHPEVREAAVFPVENRVGNPVLLAAVVLNHAGKIEKPLTEFCRERKLGGIAPRRFLLVKELPRNPAGKLMRSALPELLRRAEKLPQ
jgi:acyl-coenzyme A synthetase/AMP-(fatty) acid ligase